MPPRWEGDGILQAIGGRFQEFHRQQHLRPSETQLIDWILREIVEIIFFCDTLTVTHTI